ncbi:VOC family protein [Arenimonas sp.]|uniref:VOC family protein n=1 Tax=Arenimonas sp. TaxID=1872635 RepID=UPI0039E6F441
MSADTKSLVAFAHVADVERSIGFYADLGFRVANSVTPEGGSTPNWAWLQSGEASLMIAQASEPIDPHRQAVLFYLYFDDIRRTRSELLARGREPGEIFFPFYMPGGECRLSDPDGYVLMLAQI